MIIKPYTDADVLSLCANPTAENFPCLKAYWVDTDYTSGTTWTDRIGGVALNSPDAFTKSAGGIAIPATGAKTVTGTLPAPGTSHFALIATGIWHGAATSVTLGDTSTAGPGIGVRGGSGEYIFLDAENYLLSAVLASAPTYPMTGAMGIWADITNNEAMKYSASNTNAETSSSAKTGASSAGTIAGTWGALSNTNYDLPPASTTGRANTIALLVFDKAPTDIAAAVRWMAMNPRYIYPGFLGRQ